MKRLIVIALIGFGLLYVDLRPLAHLLLRTTRSVSGLYLPAILLVVVASLTLVAYLVGLDRGLSGWRWTTAAMLVASLSVVVALLATWPLRFLPEPALEIAFSEPATLGLFACWSVLTVAIAALAARFVARLRNTASSPAHA
jgi:hypothetical protein